MEDFQITFERVRSQWRDAEVVERAREVDQNIDPNRLQVSTEDLEKLPSLAQDRIREIFNEKFPSPPFNHGTVYVDFTLTNLTGTDYGSFMCYVWIGEPW